MAIRVLRASLPRSGGSDRAPFTESNTAVVDGVTITFSEAVQWGTYVDENVSTIWVKPVAPATTVTISSYSPAFGTIDAGLTTERLGNGAMLNPFSVVGGSAGSSTLDRQGFDSRDASDPSTQTRVRWREDRNIQPPVELSPGDTYVPSSSFVGLDTRESDKRDEPTRAFIFVHCVDDLPYLDEFAPPYAWPVSAGPKPRYRYSDIDESALPSLSTAGFHNPRPSASALLTDQLSRRLLDTGQNAARENFIASDAPRIYGKQLAETYSVIAAFICSDAALSTKRLLVKRFVQRGIDCYGCMLSAADRGIVPYYVDGGHQAGRGPVVTIAGHLLGDTTMRDYLGTFAPVTDSGSVGERGGRAYMTPAVITATQAVDWDGAGVGTQVAYVDEQGEAPAMPEWTGRPRGGVFSAREVNNVWSGPSNFYRNTGNDEAFGGLVAALLVMGLKTAWNMPAYFDYHVRWHAIRYTGDDPWRYVGGNPAARYALITNAPSTPANRANFPDEFFAVHCFEGYEYPAGVNAYPPA